MEFPFTFGNRSVQDSFFRSIIDTHGFQARNNPKPVL